MFRDLCDERMGRGTCRCWDCVRAAGLTPPFTVRHNHKTITGVEMSGTRDPEMTGDPKGRPIPAKRKRKEAKAQDASEKAALRAAVRNREAI